jgi:peptidoglycan/LPS O-acetylase OafA/YrhL
MREPAPAKPRFAYIDCVRGYAVLLVIASHLVEVFPKLPYPVRRLALSGWFGVQLFFLASSLTLLMLWYSERCRDGAVSLRAFARAGSSASRPPIMQRPCCTI